MINLTTASKKAEKFVIDNSPAICTGIGVVGLVSTAYLTGKATVKAQELLLQDAHDNQGNVFFKHDARDRVALTWKLYIPAVGTGVLSCAAIIGANRIGNRRAAAVAAAYSLSEKAFSEYKEKVVNHIGANKEQAVRDELAQDRVRANPPSGSVMIIEANKVLCYDQFSGRYFQSTMETLKKAQNDLNYRILSDNYASLNDFYSLIGLPRTSSSEEVGWTTDKLLELEFSTILAEDGTPCIAIDFVVAPVRDYYRFH